MARGYVTFDRGIVTASVRGTEGFVIWSDNSGAGAWSELLYRARDVAVAATLMEYLGQRMESWKDIVDRAPSF